MSEYTPGPWRAFTPTYDNPNAIVEVLADDHAIVGWMGFNASPWPIEQRRANARLIADASALLDALEAAQREIHRLARGRDGSDALIEADNARCALLRKHGRLP